MLKVIRKNPAIRWATIIFFLCLIVYSLLIILIPRHSGVPTTNGDEPHYLIITQSLLEDGDLDLENNYRRGDYLEYYEEEEEGELEPHTTSGSGDRVVSSHPPFFSLVILPSFWLLGYRGPMFFMALLFSLAAALTFLITKEFTAKKVAVAVTLFFFLTYPLLIYSRLVYPDTMALFLVVLGTWSSYRLMVTRKRAYAVICGFSSGFLALLHPKFFGLAVSLLVLFIMVARKEKRLYLYWLIPAAGCLVGLVILSYLTYGPNLLAGLSATAESKLWKGFLGSSSLYGVFGMYLDRAWGLIIFAPLYFLFPHGLFLQKDRRQWTRWWAFFPICIVLHTVLVGTFRQWHGGLAPVPRYLIPLAPLFIICVAVFIERCRHPFAYAAAGILALFQLAITIGAFFYLTGTYGLLVTDNLFIKHFLGHNSFSNLVIRIFPLYHPFGWKQLIETLVWIALLVVTVYAARRYYLRHGGGKPSPLLVMESETQSAA